MKESQVEEKEPKLTWKRNKHNSQLISDLNGKYGNNKKLVTNIFNARRSPIHRWYCIAEMLPINFIRALLNKKDCYVLDPFVGVGTVLVEAKLRGINAVGVDVNPFMCFVSKVKTGDYDIVKVRAAFKDIFDTDEDGSIQPPPIPHLDTYYSSCVLKKLLSLKAQIHRIDEPAIRDLFMLCFVHVATRSANIKRGPAPRFGDIKLDYPVLEDFKKHVEIVIGDIGNMTESEGVINVYNGDARSLNLHKEFDLVITSPPYCNNIDYVRHTQLELYWLGYATSSKELRRIRQNSVTSCEAMAYLGKEDANFSEEVDKIANEIKSRTDRAYDRTVRQYFSGMGRHFESLKGLLRPKAKAVYVIGDSWIKGVYIPTHKLIAKIAKLAGFKNVRLQLLRRRRKRRGGFSLGEYIITLRT
jgi:DNA modification methylase